MSLDAKESIERTVANKVIGDVVKDAKTLYTISAGQSTGPRCEKLFSTMATCRIATEILRSRSHSSLRCFD